MGLPSGRVGAWIIVGLFALTVFAVLPADADGHTTLQRYERIRPETSERTFGQAVAVYQDTVVVGAYESDEVHTFRLVDGLWRTLQVLEGPDHSDFGYSVAVDGNLLVIGSPDDNSGDYDDGAAYVYRADGDAWRLIDTLHPANDSDHSFGRAVDVAGNRIAVSAPDVSLHETGSDAGVVYLYRISGDTVTQERILTAPGLLTQKRFGQDLDLDGDRLLVGAPGWITEDVVNPGGAYVYHRSGTTWNLEASFESPALDQTGGFGVAVALSDLDLVVCDNSAVFASSTTNSDDQYALHTYHRSGSTWNLEKTFPDVGCTDVAIRPDWMLATGSNSPNLFSYGREGSRWGRHDDVERSRPTSLALDDGAAVLGFPTSGGGSAYLLGRNRAPTAVADLGTPPTDFDGDGLEPVSFTATNSTDDDGDALSHHWYVDGEHVGTGPTFQADLAVGTHEVLLAVSDPMRGTNIDKHGFTVRPPPPPTVDFTWHPDDGATTDPYRFVDQSSAEHGHITTWNWDMDGDDATDRTDPAPAWTFETPGRHRVTLTVHTDIGTQASLTKTVTVRNLPPVADAGMDQIIEDSDGSTAVQLDGTASHDADGQITAYTWRDGKTVVSRSATPTLDLEDGVHDLDLTVEDDHGARDTDRVTILIRNAKNATASGPPNADFHWDYPEAPPARAVQFHDDSADLDGRVVMWWWDFDGDGEVDATDPEPIHGFAAFGSHRVALTITDDTGNQVTTKKSVFLKNVAPVAGIDLRADAAVVGQTVVFLDASTDPDGGLESWHWDFGDDATSTEASPIHVYTKPGTYTITLTVTDDGGLEDQATANLEVAPAPRNGSAPPVAGAPGTDAAIAQGHADAKADGATDGSNNGAGDGTRTTDADRPFGLQNDQGQGPKDGPIADFLDPHSARLWLAVGAVVLVLGLVGWGARRR